MGISFLKIPHHLQGGSLLPLHPTIQNYLDSQPLELADYLPTAEEMRAGNKRAVQASSKGPDVFSIEDRTIDGADHQIPIRIYTPNEKGPFPLFIYLHGGGFVLGDLDSHDVICRNISIESGHKVISVDYRLAPEHPFPAAIDDSYAAFEWVVQNADELNGDSARISIGGDSAGGNLAAVVCLRARDRKNSSIVKQVLLYPVTDYYSVLEKSAYGSYEKYGRHGLSCLKMSEFWRHYTENTAIEKNNPYLSPIQAPSMSELPPALIVTAEYDILRDEGAAYAKRLEQEGVPVVLQEIENVNHGYLRSFPDLDESKKIFRSVANFLNQPQPKIESIHHM